MVRHCPECGRFMTRITADVGLPLSTGFPPDRNPSRSGLDDYFFASTCPYIPYVCWTHMPWGFVRYFPNIGGADA